MASMTFSDRTTEAMERTAWTAHDWYDLFLFLVQSCGIVCVGVFLYFLGPALGIAVIVGSLVALSKVKNHLASARAQRLANEDSGPASLMDVSSHYAGTARLRNDPLGVSTATASRQVMRQSV